MKNIDESDCRSTAYLIAILDKETNAVVDCEIWSKPEWEQSVDIPKYYTGIMYQIDGKDDDEATDKMLGFLKDENCPQKIKRFAKYFFDDSGETVPKPTFIPDDTIIISYMQSCECVMSAKQPPSLLYRTILPSGIIQVFGFKNPKCLTCGKDYNIVAN